MCGCYHGQIQFPRFSSAFICRYLYFIHVHGLPYEVVYQLSWVQSWIPNHLTAQDSVSSFGVTKGRLKVVPFVRRGRNVCHIVSLMKCLVLVLITPSWTLPLIWVTAASHDADQAARPFYDIFVSLIVEMRGATHLWNDLTCMIAYWTSDILVHILLFLSIAKWTIWYTVLTACYIVERKPLPTQLCCSFFTRGLKLSLCVPPTLTISGGIEMFIKKKKNVWPF